VQFWCESVSAIIAKAIRYTMGFAANSCWCQLIICLKSRAKHNKRKPNSTVGNKYSANSTNVELSFNLYRQQRSGLVVVDLCYQRFIRQSFNWGVSTNIAITQKLPWNSSCITRLHTLKQRYIKRQELHPQWSDERVLSFDCLGTAGSCHCHWNTSASCFLDSWRDPLISG
jgi:hypothetical protein